MVRVAGQGTGRNLSASDMRQRCPLSPLIFNIFSDCLARQVVEACGAEGVHGFIVSVSAARS